ncbi:DUF1206 domain-containing protein [Leeuwenhoekiella parthenopeia]|uniref:DUF1206 domain-containing protein n=1 Tax=Leeuwenhoekiella parthenopeia TaxID=2890320 RepID=A0ABS8GR59_9FLAO|nr:DUF1206 domain-containing protein [Leeuwenhoekiella parthenopeia]MCC4211636.1 DUF1206 domain-containing protein [Leeuwenhoekiella parthenopeia]
MNTKFLFFARAGLFAKAVLFLAIGVFTSMAAFNLGGFKAGSFTLMNFLAGNTLGRALLILWAIALSGYVFWRVFESIADRREFGNDLTGIAERIGFGFGGLVYAFLAVSALFVALNPETSSWLKETDMQQLIQSDLGKYTIMAIAVGMLGATLNEFYIAISRKFAKTIRIENLNPLYKNLILICGMTGYASRGITLGIASFLLWDSAFTNRDLEDTNKEAAFSVMEYLFGNWTLGVIALGFIIYACYVFVEVRYRNLQTFRKNPRH